MNPLCCFFLLCSNLLQSVSYIKFKLVGRGKFLGMPGIYDVFYSSELGFLDGFYVVWDHLIV